MRFTEFLFEYKREKTIEITGPRKLLLALANDNSNSALYIYHAPTDPDSGTLSLPDAGAKVNLTPVQTEILGVLLSSIESRDPTTNKEYTPWLARMYSNGHLKLEDINRNELLNIYNEAKKRNIIPPQYKNINSFKSYGQFEDVMMPYLEKMSTDDTSDSGKADKVYEDDSVIVVVPKDKVAACKYGRRTRWCTAATKGENYFDDYNKDGPLNIIIPKKPSYEGEKYQLQFPNEPSVTEIFHLRVNERDEPISLHKLITERFPKLKDFFLKLYPHLKDDIFFMDDSILSDLIGQVADLADIKLNDIFRDWEGEEEYRAIRDTFISKAKDLLRPTAKEFKKLCADSGSKYEYYNEIPYAIANNLERNSRRGRNVAAGLGSYIQRNIMIRKEGDGFKVYDRSA